MEIDPRVEEYLKAVRGSPQPLAGLGVEGSRRLSREQEVQYAWDPGVEVEVNEASVPVEGGTIPLRVYRQRGRGEDALPVLLWIHGGGWVLGQVDSRDADTVCRYLSSAVPCLVVSVGYRLAPEHKFPVPLEDSYRALRWTADNARALGADPGRLAVAGDSAGGNLTVGVCLLARDRGGPKVAFQAPVYPITDHNTETRSYALFARGFGLDKDDMLWFWDQYLRTAKDGDDPLASPLRADLSGLPPAFVMTAGLDTLRDEGEAYALKLREAGVPALLRRAEGMPHGFITLPFGSKEREELAAAISGALGGRTAEGTATGPTSPTKEL